MNIARLNVRIGDHEEELKDCSDDDPSVAELMRMATPSSAVITIEVPQTPEAASLLGRLVFGKPRSSRIEVVNLPDLIPALSKPIKELELSVRADNLCDNAGIVYVWQIAEKSQNALLKTKNFGKRTLDEIKGKLEDLGLSLGMQLDSIKEHLPRPPGM